MNHTLENTMYDVAQLFLLPTLILIAVLFLFAFWCLGEFAMIAWRRRSDGGRPLIRAFQANRSLTDDELDLQAHTLLEAPRVASRVTPMLGLVATMIPMGPALRALGDGQLADVANNLTVAFSAVILALLAAAITYAVAHVRRRWYADELLQIELAEAKPR